MLISVIGKGGENIAMIQSETGVKVQFAQGQYKLMIISRMTVSCWFLPSLRLLSHSFVIGSGILIS